MQQGDYNSIPYYQNPQIPNPPHNSTHIPPDHHSYPPPPPPSYSSTPPPPLSHSTAPPPSYSTAPPPSSYSSVPPQSYSSAPPPPSYSSAPPPPSYSNAPPQSYSAASPFTAGYNPTSDYSSYPQNPNSLPTAPTYTPPPQQQPQQQQPQSSSPFPRFESHGSFQTHVQLQPQQPNYPSYNQQQTVPSYVPPTNHSPNPTPEYSSNYSSQYNQLSSVYEGSYDNNNVKFDQTRGYSNEPVGKYGNYGSGRVDDSGYGNDGSADGVYAYKGSKIEPYGARGTAPKSSTWSSFDDFGRPIGHNSSKDKSQAPSAKIVKAIPKADTQQDVKSGVQKFRVKLLGESGGQSSQDVLCQIALDGIRMLDPSTSRTLRIYPLDTITRCEVADSSTLAFWSKSAVDLDPRRIRLQSNSYTTNTLLDTVTAATVQFNEMGGGIRPSESPKMAEQTNEKKKGFADWINKIKPVNEEKDHWVPDEAISKCTACGSDFSSFVRKHHCRSCGDIFCDKCTQGRIALAAEENAPVVRVCDRCMAEVSRRLSSAKEATNRSSGLQSHEDLAKKLQEEMERNRKTSSGSRSDGSGRRMKEVACPTCTVHLQVQVPSSGSETIECGVCQHPFLVSSR